MSAVPSRPRRSTRRVEYAGRLLSEAVVDRWMWEHLTGELRKVGWFERRRLLDRWCRFAEFYAGKAGYLRDLTKLAYLYGDWYGVCPQRFYDHMNRAIAVGLVRQSDHPSSTGSRAEYRLTFPAELIGTGAPLALYGLPDKVAHELGAFDPAVDREEFLAPARSEAPVSIHRLAAETPAAAYEPPVVTDPRAAAEARLLAVADWIGESYTVAAAMRAEQELLESFGDDSYDDDVAEERARRRLEYPGEEEPLPYVDVTEAEMFGSATALEPGAKAQLSGPAVQLSLSNAETTRLSRERTTSIWSCTLRKYWADLGEREKSKAKAAPSGQTYLGPAERRRAAELLRDQVWHVWLAWRDEQYDSTVPIVTEGQWFDLTTAAAFALRRSSKAEVVELCTASLRTARNLASVVGRRLWSHNFSRKEYPEWVAYRRNHLTTAEPGWKLPVPASVIGPASARAELRRVKGQPEPLGRQLKIELRPAAAQPSKHAENARQAVLLGAFDPTRDRPQPIHPDLVKPGLYEMEQAARIAAARVPAAAGPAGRDSPEVLAYRAESDARRAQFHAAAGDRARAERTGSGRGHESAAQRIARWKAQGVLPADFDESGSA